jgi:hypothetical protein
MFGAISGAFFPSFYIVIFVFVMLLLMTVRTYFKARDIYYANQHKERKSNFGYNNIDEQLEHEKNDEESQNSQNKGF